jgi:hypothetical protein
VRERGGGAFVRTAAALILVAYVIAPLARIGGAVSHDLAHRARGEDPMHDHHHDHHRGHRHDHDRARTGHAHEHDVVLRLLLRLGEADAPAETDAQASPPPDAPRFDHLVPAPPRLAAATGPVASLDGLETASPRAVELRPPSPPPRRAV